MNNFTNLFLGELDRMKKYNILAVSIFVALLWIGVAHFTQLDDIDNMVPLIIYIDASSMPLVLVAATMFFEQQEGTIRTLMVSPISKSEYILAKVFANISSNILTLILLYGYIKLFKEISLSFLGLLGASVLIAFFHSLIGFIITYKSKDFTDSLMEMMKYIFIFTIPVLFERMGLINSEIIDKILYIMPTKSATILLQGTGGLVDRKEISFALIYLLLASLVLFVIVWRKFDDFKIRESGE